jgi:hypothetical protein
MYFRRVYVVPELRFRHDIPNNTEFTLNGGKLVIKFTALPVPPDATISPGSIAEVVLTIRDPKPAVDATFTATQGNRLPASMQEIIDAMVAAKQGLPWQQQAIFIMDAMPQPFQDYSRGGITRMRTGVERFVGLLRWRYSQWGPPKAVTTSQAPQWSHDGVTWYYLPFIPQSSVDADVSLYFDDARRDEIVDLFNNTDLEEPVYRELMREANHLQKTSSRSALILAVAASEIAIKAAILQLQPTFYNIDLRTEQALPATRMYSDLPKLPVKCLVEGVVVAPPQRLLELLEKAVSARNNLLHAGAEPLSQESIVEKLNALRDLVLMVDYYRGFSWAFDQLTDETKAELIAQVKHPDSGA